MRSLPTDVADSGSTIRWIFESYLEIIEEFACDPEAFGPRRTGGRGSEGAHSPGRGAEGWEG